MALPSQIQAAQKRLEDLEKLRAEESPQPAEAPVESAPEPEKPEQSGEYAQLKHKYDVLKGKYDKEVATEDNKRYQRIQSENAELRRQVSQLAQAAASNESLVAEMREELSKMRENKQPDKPLELSHILSDEDRAYLKEQELDDRTQQILVRLAQAVGGGELKQKMNEMSQQFESFKQEWKHAGEQQRDTMIRSAIPDFEQINSDPNFHEWLDRRLSKFSNRKIRDELQDAFNSGDIALVKAGIDQFKLESQHEQPPPAAKPAATTPGKPRPTIEPNESFGSTQNPSGKRTFTREEMNKHYTERTQGRWVGREQQWQAIADEMTAAAFDNRIKA